MEISICFNEGYYFSISYCETKTIAFARSIQSNTWRIQQTRPNPSNATHVRTRPASNCDARRDGKMEMSLRAVDNFTMSPVAARSLTRSSIMDSNTPRSGRRRLGLRWTHQQSATACVINSRYTVSLSVSQSVTDLMRFLLDIADMKHEQTHRETRLTWRTTHGRITFSYRWR